MSRFLGANFCSFEPQRFVDPGSANAAAPVAISACLSGQRVRYDGAEKTFADIEWLDRLLSLSAVCPEVGAGLAVPRPPVQLVATDGGLRALGRDDPGLDVTAALENYAAASVRQFIHGKTLCGYIWKSRSPSCGFASTPVFDRGSRQIGVGSGIHARYFQRHLPWLHCVDENDLRGPQAIAAFVLICRLMFDLLRAPAGALAATHRHYLFLRRCLPLETQEHLTGLVSAGAVEEYQTAVKAACAEMDRAELLQLFARR